MSGFVVLTLSAPALAQGGKAGQETSRPVDPELAPRPVTQAVRTSAAIVIDGELDEAAWSDAVAITEFVQSIPNAGYPPTEPTVVRILYDERRLYIGAFCFDSEPDQLVITSLEQDFGVGSSTRDMDIFAITLDTFLDRRNSFIFLVSPSGAYRDGQTFNDSRQIDFGWRGVLQVETVVHDSGYTVEMAIPWTTLRFDQERDEQRWGMNILRRIRRKNEDMYWAPVDRRDPVHRMSKAGTLEGLKGLRSGRNLTLKPFTLGVSRSGENVVGDDVSWDAGGDLKLGLTPGLTLDATLRTDFSQVEVDQEQVNLTRFPLFFPERREFFVENSGSFILGDVTERNYRMGSSLRDFTLFHSRRIGLSSDREPIPILGGGRLTGRAGNFEVGLLNMQTRTSEGIPDENFAVARLRRNLGASDVGVMFVNRQAASDAYNRSFAADANLRVSNSMIVNSYVARTSAPEAAGDQTAGRLSVAWRDRLWNISAFAKHVGDGFDPGVGFVRRRGIRQGYATIGAHPRPRGSLLQEVNPYSEMDYVTDLDSKLLTRRNTIGFGAVFSDGSTLNLRYQNRFERLLEPDAIGGITIPAGDYTTNDVSVSYQSSRAKPLSGRASISGGGFFDGTRASLSASGLWRAHYKLLIDLSASHNDVDLAGGGFTADVFLSRIRYSYSTKLFTSAVVQYNSQTSQLVTNLRVNWIYSPLSDVFLVFTERRDLNSGVVLDRLVTAKVTKLLAF